jgi:hypothetical protein
MMVEVCSESTNFRTGRIKMAFGRMMAASDGGSYIGNELTSTNRTEWFDGFISLPMGAIMRTPKYQR